MFKYIDFDHRTVNAEMAHPHPDNAGHVPVHKKAAWKRYAFAVAASIAALWIRLAFLNAFLGAHSPFLFFYISLTAAAWYGGFGPGVLATLFGAVAGAYYFMIPAYSFHYESPLDHLETFTFVLTGLLISYLYHRLLAEKRALEKAEAELAQANRRKDEFIAMLSHELRNPMAAIFNGIELLKRAGDESIRMRSVSIVERQAVQMLRIVDDLMDISRIRRGKVRLQKKPVEFRDVIAAAVETVRPHIEEKRQSLRIDLDPRPAVVEADEARLVQVFTNILKNASKYTEAGGTIALQTAIDGTYVSAVISDTGVGIPPDVLPRVFDLFEQAENAVGRAQGGLGIGLNLVKRFVEMHGGTVSAASEGAGKGSRFTVRLPLAAGSDVSKTS